MSCSEFDIRDYFFGELPEAQRASAARHVSECADCGAELEQLRGVRASLLTLPDEEMPRRIGFVSDKIFEPSPFRRFLSSIWLSGARLGFVSAAMFSIALLVYSLRQPGTVAVPVTQAQQQIDVKALVAEAVAAHDSQQRKEMKALIAASDQKHQLEERALAVRVADYTLSLEKRLAANTYTAMNFTNEGATR